MAEYGECFTLVLRAVSDAKEAAEGHMEAGSASDLNCRILWEEQVGNVGQPPVQLKYRNLTVKWWDVLAAPAGAVVSPHQLTGLVTSNGPSETRTRYAFVVTKVRWEQGLSCSTLWWRREQVFAFIFWRRPCTILYILDTQLMFIQNMIHSAWEGGC